MNAMYEKGTVLLESKEYRAVRFTDTGIVHIYRNRKEGRNERTSKAIAKTFLKDEDNA